MKQDDNKKVVQLSNNRSITQESYENLAKRFKEILNHANGMIYEVRHSFDEAFTKHEHSNPRSRKLKDFEVHEKRTAANRDAYRIRKEITQEIKALEEGVLKYGIDIRDEEETDE